jgi:D-serine deaminase-like pyridoxal phosphate-dependent protein
VARALEAAGADGFCVAAFDEAVALAPGGIERPILVLYPIPSGLAGAAARNRIAVTGGDRELLDELLAPIAADPPDAPLEIQLEVESGLGRGGFATDALLQAARDVAGTAGARLPARGPTSSRRRTRREPRPRWRPSSARRTSSRPTGSRRRGGTLPRAAACCSRAS